MAETTGQRTCPYDSANAFSKATFWWMNALFGLGFRNQITPVNICDAPKEDKSSLLESKLERTWKEEIQNFSEGRSASLLSAVIRAFRWQWMLPGLLLLILETIKISQPYMLSWLVHYFIHDPDTDVTKQEAYGIGAALAVSALLVACLNPVYCFIMEHVALRIKVAVGGLIYRKVLSLRRETLAYTSAQQIATHLSKDIGSLCQCISLIHYTWASPVFVILSTLALYYYVGVQVFYGLAVMIVMLFLQAGLTALAGRIRSKMVSVCEQRVQTMSEVIPQLKLVKLQCWEKPVEQLVMAVRRSESALLRGLSVVLSAVVTVETAFVVVALMAVVLPVWDSGKSPTGQLVVCISWLVVIARLVTAPLHLIQAYRQSRQAANLVQNFLLLDEEKEQIKDLRLDRSVSFRNEPHSDWAVDIDHMTARWPLVYTEGRRRFQKKRQRSSTSSMKSLLHDSDVDHAFSLKYISLQIKKGEFLTITGVLGSGKSSLLMTLIGELPHEIGQIAVNGRLSYCPQASWIFHGSVRDNILFGEPFNRTLYQRVIRACGLVRDFELLPKGDMTLVGVESLQLSRGQRARISLARCVYHEADVYLLDDPLSSIDAQVGQEIFQRCMLDLLSEKTVVLVTQHIHYLKQADRIVVLRDGRIHEVGTYTDLKAEGVDMRALACIDNPKHVTEAAIEAEEEETQIWLESKRLATDGGRTEETDPDRPQSPTLKLLFSYLSCAAAFLFIVVPLWSAAPVLHCFSQWMLAQWIKERMDTSHQTLSYTPGDMNTPGISPNPIVTVSVPPSDTLPTSLMLYVATAASSLLATFLFSVTYYLMTTMSSTRLHHQMVTSLVNSVAQVLDAYSTDQLLGKFSQDVSCVDSQVSTLSHSAFKSMLYVIALMLVPVVINPWLAFALAPVVTGLLCIVIYSGRTIRQVKHLEVQARSPLETHVTDTVSGLETVRALGKKDQVLAQFDDHHNNHTAAWFLHLTCQHWMTFRAMTVWAIFVIVTVFVSISLQGNLSGPFLLLSLVYCVVLSEHVLQLCQAWGGMEIQMNSLESVQTIINLEQEGAKLSAKPPPPDWPSRGAISYSKMSLKFGPKCPPVLKGIDCHIKGKEKIGIVGGPGSGKSSMIASLFHLAQPSGAIYIDSMQTAKLGLHDLRGKMSLIPHDPAFFSQTLRWNLDPLCEFSDERLWYSLEQVQLKGMVERMSAGLYTEVQGGEFTVGQRQLLSLAMAILKCHKILVFDEATASVDEETDNIIQRTVRAKFRDSTVLIVAHRLFTVMDLDRVMVMEEGELRELDTPYNLLQKTDGVFTRLVMATGTSQAKQLQALAELSQHRRTSASLQLQRAVLLANEQLAQSTEDLRAGQAALNWNRFMHSQDSLDKTFLDSVIEKEKKSVAPSQKIIRRRSPGKTKRTIDEEEELLSYDRPPQHHHGNREERLRDEQRKEGEEEEMRAEKRDRERGEGDREVGQREREDGLRDGERREAGEQERSRKGERDSHRRKDVRARKDKREVKRAVVETNVDDISDSPPSSPRQTHQDGSHDSSAQQSPPKTRPRVLSGPHQRVHLREDEREQFV